MANCSYGQNLESTAGHELDISTYISDSTTVAIYSLCFQSGLFHPPTQSLIIILRVQDKLAWVVCRTLEESHVRIQSPGIKNK